MDLFHLTKIRNRQLARFLDHLKKTGQFTTALEKDVKRSFGFIFGDIESLLQGQDKENNGKTPEGQKLGRLANL